jgi:hypothetical protein
MAVAIGITMFKSQSIDQNRAAVWNDLNHFGSRAQTYYRTPLTFRGGGNSFIGFTMTDKEKHNDNGDFDVVGTPTSDEVRIKGIGREMGMDETKPVSILMVVQKDSMYVDLQTDFN